MSISPGTDLALQDIVIRPQVDHRQGVLTPGEGFVMARTPLAGAFQDAVAAVAAGERRTTRTTFVKEVGAAALGLLPR